MENTKTCLECEQVLFGRSDKKFCSDSCRSAYNNRHHTQVNKYQREINKRLSRNRKILKELNPEGKIKTHREKLLKEGFDFDYFTNVLLTRDQREYRFCYEHGYLMLENDYVLLVKRDVPELTSGG